jgi:predicted nucleic acid-binding protein
MYLVDTSILSLHQRGHPRVLQRIAATASELRFTSIVTVEEQFRGRLSVIASNFHNPRRLLPAYASLELTLEHLCAWQVLPFTEPDYQEYLRLRQQVRRVGVRDLRIAATALRRGFIVVTNNVSDFTQVAGLTVEDWTL